jgi:formiminotetrahydrofolate cyclodeaminase
VTGVTGSTGVTGPIRDAAVGAFLDDLADRSPAPAAGAAAAVTMGVAAALVAMAARFSEGPLGELAEQADRLRADVLRLADEDGVAYARVLEALRLPRDAADREEQVATALRAATDVPLQITVVGADVVAMATRLARDGNPRLRGDAETAALLAAGAARATHRLVHINVELGGLDRALAQRADELLDQVLTAT